MKNADFDFTKAPPGDQQAFRGVPCRVKLTASTPLYRFVTIHETNIGGDVVGPNRVMPFNHVKNGQRVAESDIRWWFSLGTFQHLQRVSRRVKQSVIDVARAHLAVSHRFNARMDHLCIVELKVDVYAWEGAASQQPFDGHDRSVLLMGARPPARESASATPGCLQLYVPNLAPDDVRGVYFGPPY